MMAWGSSVPSSPALRAPPTGTEGVVFFSAYVAGVPLATVRRMTLMFNSETAPYYPVFLREFGASGSSLASQVSASPVRNEAEIETAAAALAREPGGGLIGAPDPFINNHRALIISLAHQHGLPTLFAFRQHVRDGGLMSYGPDSVEI